jgi:hypothetical protein
MPSLGCSRGAIKMEKDIMQDLLYIYLQVLFYNGLSDPKTSADNTNYFIFIKDSLQYG